MKVFVVMGNDFPSAVFTTITAAEKYCDAKREEKLQNTRAAIYSKVFWRVYEFELDKGEKP
jgi:hypothetical protein